VEVPPWAYEITSEKFVSAPSADALVVFISCKQKEMEAFS